MATVGETLGTNKLDETRSKENNLSMKSVGKRTDPFSMFKVKASPCDLLEITIMEGRKITKGSFGDFIDTPDPYVEIELLKAPDSLKRTTCISNDPNPQWFETFKYYLPPKFTKPTVCKIKLLDSNITIDEDMGTVELDVNDIKVGDVITKTFKFFNDSEVDVQFKRKVNTEYDIRYSLALCKEEKDFRKLRSKIVTENLRTLLGNERGPRNENETPCIGILGSGGGYRALCGFSGALSALKELGLFDCAMYTCGLSGSTWCQSALYSHPSFPEHGVDHAIEDMKKNMSRNCLSFLTPSNILRYIKIMKEKRKSGQPTTFTDFFGLMVAEHLLGPSRSDVVKLSDFQEKVDRGQSPLPVMSCVHVRSKVSAQVFHEWVEFSPYEIGIPKYGTYVQTSDFNNKFFMGAISKVFEEPPINFLMGIWGSAYSIMLNRLMKKDESSAESSNDEKTPAAKKRARSDSLGEDSDDDSSDYDNLEDQEIEQALANCDVIKIQVTEEDQINEEEIIKLRNKPKPKEVTLVERVKQFFGFSPQESENERKKPLSSEVDKKEKEKDESVNFFNNVIQFLMKLKLFAGRELRAGKILNFMRGLETYCISPLLPDSNSTDIEEDENEQFSRLDETICSRKKKVMMVDAGLTFNSPYPVILRSQRYCDVIISFDFSARDKDEMMPFGELVLAEKWAKLHNIPFPPIDTSVYEREGLKEMYIFKDENNPTCPVVVHFCLCNVMYRKFSKPGVARDAEDEEGDFRLFAEETPYSTYDFQYEEEEFEKLHDLIRFNTFLNKQKLFDTLAECVEAKRNRVDDENHDAANLDEEKRKIFVEKFGESQASISFHPQKVDLIR